MMSTGGWKRWNLVIRWRTRQCVPSTASSVKCMKTTGVHWEAWRREAEWIRAAILNVATRWHKFTCCTFKTWTWWKLSMKPFLPNRTTLVLLLCLVLTCCVASYCYGDNNNWQPGFGHRSALIQTELCLKVWLQSDFLLYKTIFFPPICSSCRTQCFKIYILNMNKYI